MTEDQIEQAVERAMDRLDRQLMNGSLSQEEYDTEVKSLAQWARDQFTGRGK
jgi:hypothetical protein